MGLLNFGGKYHILAELICFCVIQSCGKNMSTYQLHNQCLPWGVHPYCVSISTHTHTHI